MTEVNLEKMIYTHILNRGGLAVRSPDEGPKDPVHLLLLLLSAGYYAVQRAA